MNIIQIQDRLKGLPEDALVNYVKNPMGEVPIYLALGEMQRRKDMKARFDASKPEEPSVAEKLVAETGIAAMAPQGMMPQGQGVGAPQPQQAIDPRQMAASGIAANPVNNVGKYAEGGIVGYGAGDFVKKLGKLIPGPIKRNPNKSALGAYGLYGLSDFLFGGNDTDELKGVSDEEYKKTIENYKKMEESKDSNKKNVVATSDPSLTDGQRITDKYDYIQKLVGPNKGIEAINEKLEKKKKNSLNMALINAGLGMAGGKSANFLENLTTGATAGLESYTDTQADIFDAENEATKAARLEHMQMMGLALDQDKSDLDRDYKYYDTKTKGSLVANDVKRIDKRLEDVNKRIETYEEAVLKGEATQETINMLEILRLQKQRMIDETKAGYGESTGTGTGSVGNTDDFLNLLQ